MCQGNCRGICAGACEKPVAPQPVRTNRLYDKQNMTDDDMRASAARPINPKLAVKIVDAGCREVAPPPAYNRGPNWKPGG